MERGGRFGHDGVPQGGRGEHWHGRRRDEGSADEGLERMDSHGDGDPSRGEGRWHRGHGEWHEKRRLEREAEFQRQKQLQEQMAQQVQKMQQLMEVVVERTSEKKANESAFLRNVSRSDDDLSKGKLGFVLPGRHTIRDSFELAGSVSNLHVVRAATDVSEDTSGRYRSKSYVDLTSMASMVVVSQLDEVRLPAKPVVVYDEPAHGVQAPLDKVDAKRKELKERLEKLEAEKRAVEDEMRALEPSQDIDDTAIRTQLADTLVEYEAGRYDAIAKILGVKPDLLVLAAKAKEIVSGDSINLSIIPHIVSFAMHMQGLEGWNDSGRILVLSMQQLDKALKQGVLQERALKVIGDMVFVLQDIAFGDDQKTLLHTLAAHSSMSGTLSSFIESGWKNVDCTDQYGCTPLRSAMGFAVMSGEALRESAKANIEALLENGANMYAGHSSRQPINFAMEHLHLFKEVIYSNHAKAGKCQAVLPDYLSSRISSILENGDGDVLPELRAAVHAMGYEWDRAISECY